MRHTLQLHRYISSILHIQVAQKMYDYKANKDAAIYIERCMYNDNIIHKLNYTYNQVFFFIPFVTLNYRCIPDGSKIQLIGFLFQERVEISRINKDGKHFISMHLFTLVFNQQIIILHLFLYVTQ